MKLMYELSEHDLSEAVAMYIRKNFNMSDVQFSVTFYHNAGTDDPRSPGAVIWATATETTIRD